MAGETTEKAFLELGINTGVAEAVTDFQNLGKAGSKAVRAIDKTTKAYGRSLKDVKTKGIMGLIGGVKSLVTAYNDYGKKVTRWNAAIVREQAKLATATEDQRAGIQKNIDKYKALRAERLKGLKQEHGKGAMDFMKGAGKVGKAGVATGKNAWKAGSALFQKDFKSAAEHGAKTIAAAMSSGKTLGKGMKKSGDFFWKSGIKRFGDARKKWSQGGIGGKAGAVKDVGMGAASAAMGGIGKSLGPLLKGISSLAPMLTMVAGVFGAIVKLMVDAEAQAKQMNKEILQVAGSSNQFYKYSQKGDVALQDMGDMLRNIRNDATSLDNIKWGIKKEDHMAVLTTLAQEGVALGDLQQQFDAVGKDASQAASEAKSFGGAVHIAVAYSREFGVSLQELTQFQGEMMTELGTSLTEVQSQFHSMTAGAAESGIAANKFFGIIRSVSSDLNLYNTRMEDTVHTLTLLGKVMNPRNAQKFMQFAAAGLKGMSSMDRFRMNLMGGGKMGGLVTKDLARKSKAAARDISTQTGKKISDKDILDPTKKIADILEGVADSSKGALTDTIMQLRMDQSANKRGTYGASSAAANLSQGAALQAMKNSLNIGGTGKLADRSGDLITEQLAQLNGWSKEQLDEMAKFEMSVDNQRDVLKKQLKKGGADADKANEALKKAGIDASQIDSASYDEIMDTMDKNAEENLTDAQKEMKYAQQTSQFTSTISDKIEAVLDFLMNQIYNIMGDIYDIISNIPGLGGDKEARRLTKLQLKAQKSGNKEIAALAAKSGSPDEIRHALLDSESAKKQTKANYEGPAIVDDLVKKQEALQKKISETQDADEKAKLQAQLGILDKQKDAAVDNARNLARAVDEQLGGTNRDTDVRKDAFGAAAKFAVNNTTGKTEGLSAENTKKIQDALGEGKGLAEAMDSAKISAKNQAIILDKIRLQLSPEQLMAVTQAASKITETSPTVQAVAKPPEPPPPPELAKPPAGGKPPAAAQAATAKATETLADTSATTTDQQGAMVGSLDDMNHVLEQKGIKINKSFMKNEFWKQGQDAVLDATRQALFEYFLYNTTMTAAEAAKGLKSGAFTAQNFSSKYAQNAASTGTLATKADDVKGGAFGGVVEPKSPDTMFAAVRGGETITPPGQGGGGSLTIPINVNGPGGQELAGMMRSAAMGVVAEWKRKHKYT